MAPHAHIKLVVGSIQGSLPAVRHYMLQHHAGVVKGPGHPRCVISRSVWLCSGVVISLTVSLCHESRPERARNERSERNLSKHPSSHLCTQVRSDKRPPHKEVHILLSIEYLGTLLHTCLPSCAFTKFLKRTDRRNPGTGPYMQLHVPPVSAHFPPKTLLLYSP